MILVFKRNTQTAIETMVQYLSGPMLHVDMIPVPLEARKKRRKRVPPPREDVAQQQHPKQDDNDDKEDGVNPTMTELANDDLEKGDHLEPLMAYTTYMFERFSKGPFAGLYTPATHSALYLHMNEEQCHLARDFLEHCVQKQVPYNYVDLMSCVMPGSSAVVSDTVAASEPPASLFCSQAAVLCLRYALAGERETSPLARCVYSLNSRITTPSTLYTSLYPLAQEVELEDALHAPEVPDSGPI